MHYYSHLIISGQLNCKWSGDQKSIKVTSKMQYCKIVPEKKRAHDVYWIYIVLKLLSPYSHDRLHAKCMRSYSQVSYIDKH